MCSRFEGALPKCATTVRNKEIEEAVNRAMRRKEPQVRAAACQVVGELSELATAYRQFNLADLLADPDQTVRSAALSGLAARQGGYRPEELQMLARMVREDDPPLRYRAYGCLSRAGETSGEWRAADISRAAASDVIARLDTEVTDENPGRNLLRQAVMTLGKIGRYSPRAVPALLKVYARFPATTKRDAEMRQTVVAALADIGPFSDKSLPFVVKLMHDEKLPLAERAWAAQAIGRFGPLATDHVPDLIALLQLTVKQAESGSAADIMRGITWLGETAEPVVPYLVELAQGPVEAKETI